jgi:hypothetical protein
MLLLSQPTTAPYYAAHSADIVLFIAQFALPVYFVFRWKRMSWRAIGVFLGTFAFYVIGVISGIVLNALDPERTHLLDAVWIFFGLIPSFMYCLILFAIRLGLESRKGKSTEA